MAKRFLIALGISGCLAISTTALAHGDTEKGEKLYEQYCASCHGIDGEGNGEAGKHLSPPPANLLDAMQGKIISDEYLLWTIKEGGRNVHTSMPSFETRGEISETEAKAIIRYLWKAFK